MTQEEKHNYLVELKWEFKYRKDVGFNVYSHKRLEGQGFTLNKAYNTMLEIEKGFGIPVMTIKHDDVKGIERAKLYINNAINTLNK